MSVNEAPIEETEESVSNKINSDNSGGTNFAAARDIEVEVGRDFVSGDAFVGDKAGGDIIKGDNYSGAQVTYYHYYGVPESQVADVAPAPGDPPYKGLLFYTQEDVHLFFGRAEETAKMVAHLHEQTFLAIVGASGCGKSSVIRAGIVPALKQGDILANGSAPPDGSDRWPVHIIMPTARPLESLAASLTRDSESVTAAFTFAEDLKADHRSLNLMARRLINQSGSDRLLLVIDQFEELFTLCQDENERQVFIDNLMHAIDPAHGSVTLIISLRVAFVRNCQKYESLMGAMAHGRQNLPMMKPEMLREAIVQAAVQDDWEFEEGLLDLLLRDAGFEPAVLPWLSHTLLETWKRRRGRILTFSGYAEAGGLRGAIVRKAEAVFLQFDETEQRVARNVFMRLTELGEGTQDSRRRAPLDEIIPPDPSSDPILLSVLQTLAKARLIVVGDDGMHAAHEAVIRDWRSLRMWVEENRSGLRIQRRLSADAANWVYLAHDRGALYRGVKLGQTLEWAEGKWEELNEVERAFLETSRDLIEQERRLREESQRQQLETAQKLAESERQRAEEQAAVAEQRQLTAERIRRSAKRLGVLSTIAGVLAVAALIAVFFAVRNQELANQKQRTTRARELAATAAQLVSAYPQRSLLLVVEAFNVLQENDPRVPEVEETLRMALASAGGRSLQFKVGLDGVGESITAMTISPDGQWLVAGAENGDLYLWDRTNLDVPPAVLTHGYPAKVLDVVVGPDSEWMYTSIEGDTVYQWDLLDLSFPPVPLPPTTANDYQLSLATNDRWLVGGGESGNLSIWALDDLGTPPIVIPAHDGAIYDVNFSADESWLITASGDATANIYTADSLTTLTAAPKYVIDLHNEPLFGAVISDDNQYVVTSGGTPPWIAINAHDAVAFVWHMGDFSKPLAELNDHRGHITSVSISPDSQWLATSSWDHTAHIYSLNNLAADPYVLQGHEDYVASVVFAPDSKTLITGGGDRIVRLWGLDNRDAGLIASPIVLRGHTAALAGVTISPDNQWIATAAQDGIVILWQLSTSDPTLNPRFLKIHNEAVHTMAFSHDSHWLVTGGHDAKLFLWDLTQSDIESSAQELVGHMDEITTLAFNDDGSTLISGSHDGRVLAWDMANLAQPQIIGRWEDGFIHQVGFNNVAGDREGAPQWLIAVVGAPPEKLDFNTDKFVALWDASDFSREPVILRGHNDAITTFAVSQDGRWLATADGAGLILVWDLDHPQTPPRRLTGYPDGIRKVAMSVNGRWLAVAGWSPDLYVWDMLDFAAPPIIKTEHEGWINDIAISPDGNWLVSSSPDKTARLWRLDTIAEDNDQLLDSVVLRYHHDSVGGVAFSPDSKWVVTISNDQTALLWNLEVDKLIDLACRTAGRNLRYDRDEWLRYFPGETYHESCFTSNETQ